MNTTECAKEQFLRILTRSMRRQIPVNEIVYAENDLKKIILHTTDETIVYEAAMRDLEEQLGDSFFRCHRGYLINLAHVKDHGADMILMDNDEEVYLSRRKAAQFEASLLANDEKTTGS